jgi:thermitase
MESNNPFRRMKMNFSDNQIRKTWSMALSIVVGAVISGSSPGFCAPRAQLQEPGNLPTARASAQATRYQDDILLLMPNANSEQDDVKKAIDECHGTVIGSMGSGELKVLILRTERGKLAATEKKLSDSKKFGLIQRNHVYGPAWVPNDPQYANQWHLSTIRAQQAWLNIISSPAVLAGGNSVRIAVFDSGVNSSIEELNNYYKVSPGYDAMDAKVFKNSQNGTYGEDSDLVNHGASTDVGGHGTEVASTAAAHTNNGRNGAGVAPGATIYPVRITDSSLKGSDIGIVGGLLQLMHMHQEWAFALTGGKEKVTNDNDTKYEQVFKSKITPIIVPKIVNISYGIMANGFAKNSLLQKYFKKFHDTYGGLIFVSSGNENVNLNQSRYPYIEVVSAIDQTLKRAVFTASQASNTGDCVTLTAPGTGIICTDNTGAAVTVQGTSFASPIAAGVAALVWGTNINLSNTQVEDILKRTAVKPKSGASTSTYGDGMVDAQAAVKAARGG